MKNAVELVWTWTKSIRKGQFGAMLKRIPVFQQEAVCLTKFGAESGETADQILARKDLERRSGTRAHKNEFWWGIGEKGAAQSINRLISQHGAHVVLFCAIKSQKLPENGSASDILVWRKYSVLGDSLLRDIPKHVLITSAAVTKSGRLRRTHFALICNSSVAIEIGGRVFRFSRPHYKNLSKDGKLGKSARGQPKTTALVRSTSSPISGAECDTIIDFSADLCAPYCVELSDPKQISFGVIATLNRQIANGLNVAQWTSTVSGIRM
jgi:hypothetical protein